MVFGDVVTILIALAVVALVVWMLPRFKRQRGKPNFRSGVSFEKPQQEGASVNPRPKDPPPPRKP